MKRTAPDAERAGLKRAKGECREKYVEHIKSMMDELKAAYGILNCRDINDDSPEKKKAQLTIDTITMVLQENTVYCVKLFLHDKQNPCTVKKFLTREEAQKTAEQWSQIPGSQTLIVESEPGYVSGLEKLLEYKVSSKPKIGLVDLRVYHSKPKQNVYEDWYTIPYKILKEVTDYLDEMKEQYNIEYEFDFCDNNSGREADHIGHIRRYVRCFIKKYEDRG